MIVDFADGSMVQFPPLQIQIFATSALVANLQIGVKVQLKKGMPGATSQAIHSRAEGEFANGTLCLELKQWCHLEVLRQMHQAANFGGLQVSTADVASAGKGAQLGGRASPQGQREEQRRHPRDVGLT